MSRRLSPGELGEDLDDGGVREDHARRGDDSRLRAVLDASSFLVDGAAASRGAAPGVILPDAAVIEVLPQFAGG